MPSPDQLIKLLAPSAAAIMAADADAISRISTRKDEFALLDHHPAASAMANERRAVVGTALRTTIAPAQGWVLLADHLQSGAYEWQIGAGIVLRLSKTTRESRQEATLAQMGVQSSLFDLPRPAPSAQDIVLIRLNGSPLGSPTIDVANVNGRGKVLFHISMKTIAKSMTTPVPRPVAPRTPVALPGDKQVRHSDRS